MNMLTRRQILPVLLVALMAMAVVAQPASVSSQTTIDVSFQPVVVGGTAIAVFHGVPVDQLFVYAYRDGAWTQIPFQIDEKVYSEEKGQRVYTAEGDGRLDPDEELVFMLKDMGEQAPWSAWVDGAEEDIRIELAADAGEGGRRWAYLFHGSQLSRTFTGDYVHFSGAAQRVIAERYQVGFLENGLGLSELRLNDSGIDILDRTKIRVEAIVGFVFRRTFTEDDLPIEPEPIVPVKDGPVRLIWGERGGFAYGSLFQLHTSIQMPELPLPGSSIKGFRFSWDFNDQAVATTTPTVYLDANMTEPVVIDGQPDDVPTEPVPAWRQISHATGTIIVTADVSSLGGTQSNYYKDDATLDPDDTGDGRSYGDNGFAVEGPNTSFTLDSGLLVLPPTTENVGAAYAGLLAAPPAFIATLQTPAGPLQRRVYLPLVRR